MANSKRNGILSSAILFATAVTMSLSACTKTKETKSMVDPNAYVAKKDYDGKQFSLVRGIEEADSNNTVFAVPGFSDDFGFVKVRITETELQFIEVFNPYNREATQSILASFPIKDHFDIQREVNDFQESTHKIVEKKERPWNQREFMRVDWSSPNNSQSKLWQFTEAGEKVTLENVVLLADPVNENGHISWLTEFSVGGDKPWWLPQAGSRVVSRTHLMPVKQTDFQPVNYRNADFNRFGMFFTQQRFEDPQRGLTDSNLENHTFAQLHNVCEPGRTDATGRALTCSTNTIVWHVNKGFPQKYREVTRQVVQEWNATFKEALGRKDDVVTLDESIEVDIINPRYNIIALYPEKASGGLLGVAQEVNNPITGEMIASRATIYQDGINSQLAYVDDLVSLILADDQIRQTFLATAAEAKERTAAVFSNQRLFISGNQRRKLGINALPVERERSQFEVRRSVREIAQRLKEPAGRSMARKEALMKKLPEVFATTEQARLGMRLAGYDETFGLLGARRAAKSRIKEDLQGLEQLHDVGSSLREERARMINQAETGVHGAELVDEATLNYVKRVLAAHPEAADFKAQVELIKHEVEQKTFYTTLLHEMGHTFGLRHNFQASADSKHYHPEFFRISKQIEAEKNLPAGKKTVSEADLAPYMFSSIMDYGGEFYAQVGGLGPYDKAAIRYAYNRSIDKENDPIVKAKYQFCTDHQVNESILCRRFDRGRNVSEIVFNQIESYHTNYLLSHSRRDRANFEQRARSYAMNALVRTFIPIRQVMDESLFALIDAKTVAAGDDECDLEYWKKSVDAGEIANICNRVEAERAGVDPTNLETFENGLFGAKGLRKNPTEYVQYGLADLLFANVLAKQFFTDVLGSTEPGTYIAEPVENKKNVFLLQKLPSGKNLDESLAAFANDRGLQLTPELITGMKSLVGEVKPGRYGKDLESKWDETDSVPRQITIGSFWDKYVAMIALGLKDIGVEKYARHSMTGNAYSFPTTKGFATDIISSMIVQNDRLLTIPFKTPAGMIPALATPALNPDIRAIATVTAMTDFVSDQDQSIIAKMSVCSIDEKGCIAPFKGQKVAEFMTASGQDVYRAAQTLGDDSIAFTLVSEAAKIDQERKEWVEKLQSSSDVSADNIMKLDKMAQTRESLEKSLASLEIADLTKMLPTLFATDKPSMWLILNMLATQSEKVPVFISINMSQQANGVLGAAATIIGKSIEALDPNGQCPPPVLPEGSDSNSAKLPAVIGLEAMISGQSSKFSAPAPLFQARGENQKQNGSEAKNGEPKNGNEPAVDCAAVVARRDVILAAGLEFKKFAVDASSILNGTIEAKLAPLRVKRATDELERAETNLTLIRKIAKATGLQ